MSTHKLSCVTDQGAVSTVMVEDTVKYMIEQARKEGRDLPTPEKVRDTIHSYIIQQEGKYHQ